MAHIPYGYRIENGRAVTCMPEAGQVQELFRLYLSGLSIRAAKEMAGIPVCVRTANKMLKRETYLGDEYYPAIIEPDIFHEAEVERAARCAKLGNHKTSRPQPAVPVRTQFGVSSSSCTRDDLTPARRAALLYSMIIPGSDKTITPSDKAKMKARISTCQYESFRLK